MPSIGVSQIGLGLGQHQDYLWANAFARPLMDGDLASFDRNGAGSVFDWEGLINSMSAHVARQEGLRHPINLLKDADITDVSNWSVDGGVTFTYEGNGIFRVQNISAGSADAVTSPTAIGGIDIEDRNFLGAVEVWNADGTNSGIKIQIKRVAGGSFVGTVIDRSIPVDAISSSTAVTYGFGVFTGLVSNTGVLILFDQSAAATPSDDFYFRFPTIEEVTGQANQVTSGVIPVDTPEGPELMDSANALSVSGEYNSLDDISGLASTRTVETSITNGSDFALKIVSTSSNGRAYVNIEAQYGLVDGKKYQLSVDARHLGSGGSTWRIKLGANNSGNEHILREFFIGNTTYFTVIHSWTHDSTYKYFIVMEHNATDDGGAYLDNFSLREATTGHLPKETLNGNTVTDNVVTEADGLLLHPRKAFRLPGYRTTERHLRPDIIKNSTAYALGDIVLTSAQVFPGCGNGFVYQCTTAGTTDGSVTTESDFWTATIGGTETNNGVVFENKGHLKYTGMLFEPATTQDIPTAGVLATGGSASTYPTSWSEYSDTGNILSVVGEGMSPLNPAARYIDIRVNNASGSNKNGQVTFSNVSVPGISQGDKITVSAFLQLTAGTEAGNTKFDVIERDGADAYLVTNSADIDALTSSLLRYDQTITVSHASAAKYRTNVAFSDVPDGSDFTVRITIPNSCQQAFLTAPILAAATRVTEADALNYTISQIMHRDAEGFFLLDLVMDVDKADLDSTPAQRIYTLLTANRRGLEIDIDENIKVRDGTNAPQRTGWVSKHIIYRLACRWNTALDELQLFLNGTTEAATPYDGSFNDDGLLHFFENITQFRCWMSGWEYGRKDVPSASLLAATAYDGTL